MKQWLELLDKVTRYGEPRADRTGVGTRALFGEMLRVENTASEFPAVTTKQFFHKQCFAEMACFLHAYSSLDEFHSLGCNIWDANAAQTSGSKFKPAFKGDLGRIYGVQWRAWTKYDEYGYRIGFDQLKNLVQELKTNPYGRRHIVTNWNPSELDEMVLPPCHYAFQAYVRNKGILDLLVTMRSVDLFIGLPFDIAGYALLQRLLAQTCGLESGRLTFSLGDAHIYNNHVDQVATVLSREPLPPPVLLLDPTATIDNFHPDMAQLHYYKHHGPVKAEMAT